MCRVSVIVPVYQVEAYLPGCLDSILAQTFEDFELILVDDGTKDDCPRIMAEYAAHPSGAQGERRPFLGAKRGAGHRAGRVYRVCRFGRHG